MHLVLLGEQIDASENITFPQLRLRAVIKFMLLRSIVSIYEKLKFDGEFLHQYVNLSSAESAFSLASYNERKFTLAVKRAMNQLNFN